MTSRRNLEGQKIRSISMGAMDDIHVCNRQGVMLGPRCSMHPVSHCATLQSVPSRVLLVPGRDGHWLATSRSCKGHPDRGFFLS